MSPRHVKRIFAHSILFRGIHYDRCVAELDVSSGKVSFFPFEQEIHSTRYISGEVILDVANGDFIIRRPSPLPEFKPRP